MGRRTIVPFSTEISTSASRPVSASMSFGINTPWQYQVTRFGYTANQEGDCSSNDTAIGFGLAQNPDNAPDQRKGAGYHCLSSNCSKGNVNTGANGFLWIK